jgi:hypothetical protein
MAGAAVIRVVISGAAFEAIAATLPKGSSADAERSISGKKLVWLPKAIHAQLEAMQRPKESLSDLIVRLFAADTTAKAKRARS